MQAISNDVGGPDPDLAGLLHSPELEAELEIIDPAVLAGPAVTGTIDDLDEAWFSAFDDTVPVDDGIYEDDPVPSVRAPGPLRFAFAIGAAATAALVALAAM